MVDTESDQYKKPINDEGYSEGLTPYENNYTSSQITPPSTSNNNNNYTPMEEVKNGITKNENNPLYTGGQCSKNKHYVFDFFLIGFNITDIIFYCFKVFNIFLIWDTLISLPSSLYLLYCLIKNKDLKLTKLALIFLLALIALGPRIYGLMLIMETIAKLQGKESIYGNFMLIGFFNLSYKVFFYFVFIFTTCLS